MSPIWSKRLGCAVAAAMWAGAGHAAPEAAPVNLDQYRGKVVYLDFWASWCGPCKLSFPYMQKMTSKYPADSFVVLAVNLDKSRPKADTFLAQVGNKLPVVYDPAGATATKYAVKEMPTSVLIGRDGKVRYVHKGFFLDKAPLYEAHIAELLNEK
ncbi:MAG: TlpA disulfide reductase family protein [Caulobacteraceae bacterium]